MVFTVPALASVIGNAEKIACGDPAGTAAREDRIKGI
jgi:hypothetical protein